MFQRQKTGSVVCPACGLLVGVNDSECFNCGRKNPGMWGFTGTLKSLGQDLGFVQIVIGSCVVLYVFSLLLTGSESGGGGLLGLSPSGFALYTLGASGYGPVVGLGRWWTLLSAGWLHGGILHIFFNLMWVRQLVPVTADIYGPGRMVIIYTLSSVSGFLLSTLWGSPLTVGASAPIFGLLGALIYSGRRGVATAVSQQAKTFAIVLFVFGFLVPHVDNAAHLGGLLGGYFVGAFLNPLLEERTDHLFIAMGCLLITLLSIVFSYLLA